MGEIGHQALPKHLSDAKTTGFSPVYLVFGEPFLCQKACQAIINAIVPDTRQHAQCVESAEHVDRSQVVDLLERLNTYSFFSAIQIVVLRNILVFSTSQNRVEPVKQIKKRFDNNDMNKAADLFLRLIGQSHLTLEDLSPKVFAETFNLDMDAYDGLEWVTGIINYCQNNGLQAPQLSDDASLLLNAVNRGFPKQHHLILTAEAVDKRTSLYKAIKNNGVVIDCSVAKGNRKKDREAQQQLIYSQVKEMLAAGGKVLSPKAFEAMYELIGFDMHAFSRAIEKLISYTGTKPKIEVDDIQAVLTKSREEPIYELTGAISDKNTVDALRVLSELLGSGYHYLQILMAITNQVRRLILVKGFITSEAGTQWRAGMAYDQFKNVVMPVIQSYDNALIEKISHWTGPPDKPGGGQKKQKPVTDQVIARQPNNPYPVYQQIRKADKFTQNELLAALNRLHEADVMLKTTGRVPEFVLQELIISICGNIEYPTPKN